MKEIENLTLILSCEERKFPFSLQEKRLGDEVELYLVPMLCVGMQLVTLCVNLRLLF
ncbi:MAG: hypothetical protein K8S23_11940 [Candidatus Cloacimonetes bacterium]|nr:hypothetical protein [Candidatus Cloacimonadota bacterium]